MGCRIVTKDVEFVLVLKRKICESKLNYIRHLKQGKLTYTNINATFKNY